MMVPAATPIDASAMAMDRQTITNATISPANKSRSICVNYNNCNGILSVMTPSITGVAPSSEPFSTKQRKAKSTSKKAAPSNTRWKKNSPAVPPSSPCNIMYAAATFAASFASSKTVVPPRR